MAKLQLLEQYRERDGLDWGDAKLQLIDLQYADVRPEKGLYHRLVARGPDRAAARPTTRSSAADARAAGGHPRLLPRAGAWRSTPTQVAAASWDSVIFDLPGRDVAAAGADDGPAARHARRTSARCSTAATTAEELVAALTDR